MNRCWHCAREGMIMVALVFTAMSVVTLTAMNVACMRAAWEDDGPSAD